MSVTLRDVAGVAGVDPSVVSAVLHGSKRIRVSEKKRAEILALVEKMNYHVNVAARALITRRNFSVGVLLCSTTDRFYAEMIGELQCQLAARGYTGIFGFWSNRNEIAKSYEMVISRGVDAIITCHDDRSLIPSGIPVMIYGAKVDGFDCMVPDWRAILRNSVQYLYDLGHRKIGYLGFQEGDVRSELIRDVFAECALPWNDNYIGYGIGFADDAMAAARKMFSSTNRPEALLARNDTMAIAAISVAGQMGIRVPEDLSVVGIDNIIESQYSNPPLTTNGVCIKTLAGQMLDRLFRRIAEPDLMPEITVFSSELTVRKSCAVAKIKDGVTYK